MQINVRYSCGMQNQKIPRKEPERRYWIIYQLRLKGYSLASLGRKLGLSREAPRKALIFPYPKMEKFIGSILDIPPHIIWPERYNDKGIPNRPLGRRPKIKHASLKSTMPRKLGKQGKGRG